MTFLTLYCVLSLLVRYCFNISMSSVCLQYAIELCACECWTIILSELGCISNIVRAKYDLADILSLDRKVPYGSPCTIYRYDRSAVKTMQIRTPIPSLACYRNVCRDSCTGLFTKRAVYEVQLVHNFSLSTCKLSVGLQLPTLTAHFSIELIYLYLFV